MAVYKKEDQWVADFYIGGRKGSADEEGPKNGPAQ
jgi:hypothetical protein